ncbi:MAG TPA: hypothetical protein VF532_22020 [Candidatus Angelobacter sp.]
MPGLLRDLLISFCPERARRALRPESTHRVVVCGTWTGLTQFVGFVFLLVLRYRSFMFARMQQWGPHLRGSGELVQSAALLVTTLEFLIYPLSLCLLYFAAEGMARFVAGLISSQVVPSLPVFLAFRLAEQKRMRRETIRLESLPPDTVEFLAQGRVRIASAHRRESWNASVTIGISGQFHEIEHKEPAMPGRPFVFVLKPAGAGRALRGYEEYDLSAATVLNQPTLAAVPSGDGPVEN